MTMELKYTDDPEYVEIHDETGMIGEIQYLRADAAEPADEEGWVASFDELNGIGRQTAHMPDAAEAFAAARPLYEDLVKERRRLARFYRNQNTRPISIPMGGQPEK